LFIEDLAEGQEPFTVRQVLEFLASFILRDPKAGLPVPRVKQRDEKVLFSLKKHLIGLGVHPEDRIQVNRRRLKSGTWTLPTGVFDRGTECLMKAVPLGNELFSPGPESAKQSSVEGKLLHYLASSLGY
jgi:hypothetical protein